MKIPVTFSLRDQFANVYSFKKALKTFAMQNGFDYYYKHNDMGMVSVVCREHS